MLTNDPALASIGSGQYSRRTQSLSAVIARCHHLLLREAEQLLADGLDEGSGGVTRVNVLSRCSQVTHGGCHMCGGMACRRPVVAKHLWSAVVLVSMNMTLEERLKSLNLKLKTILAVVFPIGFQ